MCDKRCLCISFDIASAILIIFTMAVGIITTIWSYPKTMVNPYFIAGICCICVSTILLIMFIIIIKKRTFNYDLNHIEVISDDEIIYNDTLSNIPYAI